jgi:ribose transport system permease protein
MGRLLGILLMVVVLYGILLLLSDNARSRGTQLDIATRLGFYGVLTVGVGVLIVSGGIDLSIGATVSLGAVCFSLLVKRGTAPWQAALLVTAGGAAIGVFHGLLVTKVRLQPFLVTLCGLFIYRGVARWMTGDDTFRVLRSRTDVNSLRDLLITGTPLGVPNQLVLLVLVATLLALFLHGTKYGRYLYAIGANEEAARYAGIPTHRYKILAYVICSTLAGLGSVLYILFNESDSPSSAGSLLELYAITGAVLGGCSLRGGEGTIPGMFLGAAVLPLLYQLCSFSGTANAIEYAVIGFALLLGTIVDEVLKRRAARRG